MDTDEELMNTPKAKITAWPMNDDWNSITGSWSRNTYYSEVAAEYTLSSHVDDIIAEARDSALKEAALLCHFEATSAHNEHATNKAAARLARKILSLRITSQETTNEPK